MCAPDPREENMHVFLNDMSILAKVILEPCHIFGHLAKSQS